MRRTDPVTAKSEATRQSLIRHIDYDCFASLAMTGSSEVFNTILYRITALDLRLLQDFVLHNDAPTLSLRGAKRRGSRRCSRRCKKYRGKRWISAGEDQEKGRQQKNPDGHDRNQVPVEKVFEMIQQTFVIAIVHCSPAGFKGFSARCRRF